jgi:protein-tyrosine phosphatase
MECPRSPPTGRHACTRWPRCCGGSRSIASRSSSLLTTLLRRRGVVNSDELRDAIERLPPQQYLAASYYERWLGALETLVTEKGLA